METCTFNNLQAGSRAGILIAIVLFAGIASVAGGLGGWYIAKSQEAPRPGTILDVTVNPDFAVTFNQSGVVLHPSNSSYNCSMLYFMAIRTAADDFDGIMAYMKDHPEYYFGYDNITDVTGDDMFQFGMTIEYVTNELFNMGSSIPRRDAKLDGNDIPVDFGNYAVLFFFEIGIFINGTDFETYTFGFSENEEFIDAMSDNKANYDAFNSAIFIRDLNTLVINSLNVDLDDYQDSLVDAVFNGEHMILPWAAL